MSDTLDADQIAAADLADWRFISGALHSRFRTRNFATGLQLVNLIGEAAEQADHHPDLDLRYPHVNVRLFSHDVFGVTDRDIALARRISQLAAGIGVDAAPSMTSVIDLALDTPGFERIKPFWRAVMGYRDHPKLEDEVRTDDAGQPAIWFQASGSVEPRQRFHVDVHVPPEVAQERIDAAVAAGGQVVDRTKTFVVLADADGNKACVCF